MVENTKNVPSPMFSTTRVIYFVHDRLDLTIVFVHDRFDLDI